MPPRPAADDVAGALRADTPAVVNMLTNDATVTAAGFRATMIDLAARGWLRILPPEDDLEELARVRPAATAYQGDALAPARAARPAARAVPVHHRPGHPGALSRGRHPRLLVAAVQRARRRRGACRPGSYVAAGPPTDLARSRRALGLGALCWLLARGTGDTDVAVIDSVGVAHRRAGRWRCCWSPESCASPGSWLRPSYTHTDDGVDGHPTVARGSRTARRERVRRPGTERRRDRRPPTRLRHRDVPRRRRGDRTAARTRGPPSRVEHRRRSGATGPGDLPGAGRLRHGAVRRDRRRPPVLLPRAAAAVVGERRRPRRGVRLGLRAVPVRRTG